MKKIFLSALLFVVGCGGSYTNYNPNPGNGNGTSNTSEPMDGHWQVKSITCNGAAASAGVSSLYSSPNSWTMSFSGASGSFSLAGNAGSCVMTLPLSLVYSGTSISVSSNGVYSCAPANCNAGCGTHPSIAYTYTYTVNGSSATLQSQNNFDTVCSSAGQGNPPQYNLSKQ